MKCKECGGSGWIQDILTDEVWECDKCNGKGVVEPLTEKEYIQTCNTEQLAEELLAWWFDGANTYSQFGLFKWEIDEAKEKIMEWLKQPHTTKE